MFYANNKTKIHGFIFVLCILLYLFSPKESSNASIQEVSAKEATTKTGGLESGVLPKVQSGAKEDRKEQKDGNTNESRQVQLDCNAECKIKTLIELGIREEIASSLVINCKALAENPVNCIKIGASIVKNESGGGTKCRTYNKWNCFGLQVNDNYKNYEDGVIHWIGKFNKRWYNAKNLGFFYSPAGKLPPSRYCVSEKSSNTTIGCPRGLKISQDFYNSIHF